jgi:hypothetical protein
MNTNNASIPSAPIPASAPLSRRLSIRFDSQPELAIPLTSVRRPHTDPAGPHEVTPPVVASVVEAAPTPYSHWGINE